MLRKDYGVYLYPLFLLEKYKKEKKMQMTDNKKLDIKKWVTGTIITAILPFLAASFSWAEDDFSNNFFTYFPYIDALLLLYTVAINCYILTFELEGNHKNIIIEKVTKLYSLFLAAIGALFYMHLMGKEKNNFDSRILNGIVIATVINVILGIVYICFDYKNISIKAVDSPKNKNPNDKKDKTEKKDA